MLELNKTLKDKPNKQVIWVVQMTLFSIPPMFKCALSIGQPLPHPAYFRTPYIAGVNARTCFLSMGFVMESAMFRLVLM